MKQGVWKRCGNTTLLDTPPDQALDDLTALAAQICEAPISLISLVDDHREWCQIEGRLEHRRNAA